MRAHGHGVTDVGRRAENQDALVADDGLGLYAVADGVGGVAGGRVASALAIETLARFFERGTPRGKLGLDLPEGGFLVARERMGLAVRMAHRQISRKQVGTLGRMSTTLAAVAVQDGQALIAHVGDSRVYRLRDGALELLTRDHSLAGLAAAAGMTDTMPNMLTRALGSADARPALRVEEAVPGDRFLLATDGLTDAVRDGVLAELLAEGPPPAVATRLLREALHEGAHDNVTAVVVAVA